MDLLNTDIDREMLVEMSIANATAACLYAESCHYCGAEYRPEMVGDYAEPIREHTEWCIL